MLPKDKFFARLLLALTVLGMSVSVWSATVYPLYFNDVSTLDTATQNRYWDNLMKYKLWGTTGINLTDEGEVILEDVTGYSGTASGDIKFGHDYSLGGPILSGGIVEFRHFSGANMLEGPLRSLKGAKYPAWSQTDLKTARFDGPYCINGKITGAGADNDNTFQEWESLVSNGMYYGDNYDFCPDKVPAIDTLLSVPELPLTGVTWEKGIYADVYSPVHYLHVPPDSIYKNEYGTFDKYIEDLVVSATPDFKLYVLMPPEGRLTRIFVKEGFKIDNSAHKPVIQVVYVNEGTHFDKSKMEWDLTDKDDFTYVSNQQYAGNLLFYTNKDVNWGSTDHPSYQGSFITTGSFYIGNDFTIAGQIISNYLEIRAPFKGDFKYVPFDPPILDPTAIAKGKFVESSEDTHLPISLDKKTSTNVSFKYCFALKDSSKTGADTASIEDLDYDKAVLSKMPICSGDTVFAEVKIAAGSKEPQAGYEVYLNAKKDGLTEGVEILPLYVFDMLGAVFSGNKRSGTFYLNIYDGDPPQFDNKDKDPYGINENTAIAKVAKDSVIKVINLKNVDWNTVDELVLTMEDVDPLPNGVPTANDLFNFTIVKDSLNKKAYAVISVKNDSLLDYETTAPDYRVILTLKDDLGAENCNVDTIIRTVSVINVNEDPIIVEQQEFDVFEHQGPGAVVGTIVWGEHDSVPEFRKDIFEAIDGATDLFSVDSTGVITTKKDLDYETMDTAYTIVVKLVDKTDPTLFDIDTVVVHVHNVNEAPWITTDTIDVTENPKVKTVVDTIEADDHDFNDTKEYTLVKDPSGCFDVAANGSVTISEGCKGIDREKDSVIVITVQVKDSGDSVDVHNITVIVKDVPPPTIEVTDTTWTKPKSPIYTNEEEFRYCWIINAKKDDGNCADTTLKPGKNEICKEVSNLDGYEDKAKDCMTIYYSNAAPVVTISANSNAGKATNIFTIVEKTDKADTNIYVNKPRHDIEVTVTDSATGVSKSFKVNVDLEKTVTVPQKTYDKLAAVVKEAPALDEEAKGTSTPVNGNEVSVSYSTKIAGTDVVISYVTDNKGEVVKQTVINDKGKEESIKVMEVSYETEIDGKKVTVSYYADAVTGTVLVKDASGRLMTESAASAEKVDAGVYSVSYKSANATGDSVTISYAVDKKGNMVKNSEGNIGYSVSYTYVNEYGNSAKQSIFIVLDTVGPKVEILSPVQGAIIRANSVAVEWTVNGEVQDTLVVQGLEKGANYIVRYYCDKAGNKDSAVVYVVMKDGKNVDVSVEQPVTVVTKDKVREYYKDEASKPKPGQTYAVSIMNPSKDGEEVETLIGGSFGTREGSGEEPYKNVKEKNKTKATKHLGPTLALDIKLPTVMDGAGRGGVGGLATLDELMSGDMIPLEEVAADNSKKVSVEEYVAKYCEEGFDASDVKRANLYRTHARIKIWVYTTLGNFVDYYTFTQDLNDPDYTNEAGTLRMFFEMKPDADGNVRSENGKLYATGAYVYKVEAKLRSDLRCTLPPVDDAAGKKKGDVIKSDDDLLKAFGYRRPANK